MFGRTKLGYEGGEGLSAEEMLKPIGEGKNHRLEAEGLRRASVIDYKHEMHAAGAVVTNGEVQQPEFDHSPVGYVHKHTENVEYNSLMDPLLKKHFRRQSQQKILVEQALVTPDGYVLHTSKKHHVREQMSSLKRVAEAEMEQRTKQQEEATFDDRKRFEAMCQKKVAVWRATQRKEADMVHAIKERMMENRVSAEDAPLTEQGQIYVDTMKERFDYFKEQNEIREIGLQAERAVKQAAWEKKLRRETEARKAAYTEAMDLKAAELTSVKQNIVNTKARQKASMEKSREMLVQRQQKATAEAKEFRHTMQTVFAEREQQQLKDIETRKAKRAAEVALVEAKRKADLEEKLRLRTEREAREKAEHAEAMALLAAEEAQRKKEQQAEKVRRAEAKRKFQQHQLEVAKANKEQAIKEREAAKAAEQIRTQQQIEERQERLEKNMAEKAERTALHAKRMAEVEAQRKFEAKVARELMDAELKAAEAQMREEERLEFEKEMAKAEQEARQKAKAKKDAAEAAKRKAEEEAHEAKLAVELAMKAEIAKKKKAEQKKENLRKARAEMERRIAYMNKFGA